MGGKSGGSATPPDFGTLIPLQSQANTNQFLTGLNASRINSITPFGTTNWYRPGVTPGGDGQLVKTPETTPRTGPMASGARPYWDANPGMAKVSNGPGGEGGGVSAGGDGGEGAAPGPGGVGGDGTGAGGGAGASPGGGPNDNGVGVGGTGTSQAAPNWAELISRMPDPSSAGPWTVETKLSPEQQKILEQQQRLTQGRGDVAEGLLGNLGGLASPRDFASMLPSFDTQYGSATRDASEKAYYDRANRYFEPQVEKDRKALQDRLIQQGLNVDSEGYSKAIGRFEDTTARSRADMRDQAIIGGGREATDELARLLSAQQQKFGQETTRAGMAGQDRSQSLNELLSLISGSQLMQPSSPLALGEGNQPAGTDILGAAQQNYGNQLGASNAAAAQEQSMMNGLLSAAAIYFASDRRLKADVQSEGNGLYTFRYLGGKQRYLGRMAEDAPASRKRLRNGFWEVEMSWALGA